VGAAVSRRTPKPKTSLQTATLDEIEAYIQRLADEHQQEWHKTVLDAAPQWTFLLSLHLRLVELEKMKSALPELLP
jgi:hypothetical protein